MKRSPMPRSTRRVRPISEKRRSQLDERAGVRAKVIERDQGVCAGWKIDGCPHDHDGPRIHDRSREVHELQGGSMRSVRWLDPDWCLLVCHPLNQWISNGSPREAERRGLRVPSWGTVVQRDEAERLRRGWQSGATPDPSWFPSE